MWFLVGVLDLMRTVCYGYHWFEWIVPFQFNCLYIEVLIFKINSFLFEIGSIYKHIIHELLLIFQYVLKRYLRWLLCFVHFKYFHFQQFVWIRSDIFLRLILIKRKDSFKLFDKWKIWILYWIVLSINNKNCFFQVVKNLFKLFLSPFFNKYSIKLGHVLANKI